MNAVIARFISELEDISENVPSSTARFWTWWDDVWELGLKRQP